MKEIKVFLIVFTAVLGLIVVSCQPPIINPDQPPIIRFVHVPPIGGTELLEGTVNGVNPFAYKIVVYIFVDGNWWIKPYYNNPLTNIDWFSHWTCDIVTGGNDPQATLIAVYLVPNGTELEITGAFTKLPQLSEMVAFAMYNRETNEETHTFPGSEGEGEGEGENPPCQGITTPTLAFTSVPPIGSFDWLEGTACNVEPAENVVVVYIRVDGNWWIKPYFATPLTTINADGTWRCDIVTGGHDELADSIIAFLLPAGAEFPSCGPCSSLPDIPGKLAFIQQDRS